MDDLLPPGELRLLWVGINPGLWSAAANAPFARRGNRFYPALSAAGITDRVIDASAGLTEADRRELFDKGIGVTNLSRRATARADELAPAELRAGAAALADLVRQRRPKVVAVLGITSYRTAFQQPKATIGLQPAELEGARLYALPNPSGLNAHETVASLATLFRQVARDAGIDMDGPQANQAATDS